MDMLVILICIRYCVPCVNIGLNESPGQLKLVSMSLAPHFIQIPRKVSSDLKLFAFLRWDFGIQFTGCKQKLIVTGDRWMNITGNLEAIVDLFVAQLGRWIEANSEGNYMRLQRKNEKSGVLPTPCKTYARIHTLPAIHRYSIDQYLRPHIELWLTNFDL